MKKKNDDGDIIIYPCIRHRTASPQLLNNPVSIFPLLLRFQIWIIRSEHEMSVLAHIHSLPRLEASVTVLLSVTREERGGEVTLKTGGQKMSKDFDYNVS